MRKKNKKEQGTDAFSARPFKALKGFIPQSPPAAVPAPQEPVPDGEEGDEALFLEAVSGARRIGRAIGRESERAARGPAGSRDAPDDDGSAALFLSAMGGIGTVSREEKTADLEEGIAPRSSSSRMRQLKRGTIRINQELDLHGYLREEALRRLERFLRDAAAQGQQAVLVITGKGINSPEGPVLQGAVAAWLRDQGRGLVAEFLPAPRDRGGSGAFVVFLKKR